MQRLKGAFQHASRKQSKASATRASPRAGGRSPVGEERDAAGCGGCGGGGGGGGDAGAADGLRRKTTAAALTISFEELDAGERAPGDVVTRQDAKRGARRSGTTRFSRGEHQYGRANEVVLYVSPRRLRFSLSQELELVRAAEGREDADADVSF